MKRNTIPICLVFGLSVIFTCPEAFAQKQYAFPQKGQSAEQQKKDEYECHNWAVKQSNYDPTSTAQAQPPQSAGPERGSGVRGAGRGAAAGAAVGAIGGDAGKGAAVGAGAGAVGARGQSRREQAKTQEQASAQQSAGQQEYAKAKAACLEGKGYSVKG